MFPDKRWVLAACIYVLVGVSECQVSPSVLEVVELSNRLVPKLLQSMYENEKDFVVSPFGLLSNLAIITEGLDGKSREEISNSLGLRTARRNPWPTIRNGFGLLFKEFEDNGNNTDVSGTYNRAIIHSSLPLAPEYSNVLSKYFRANVTQIQQDKNVTAHVMEVSSDTGVISHWKDYKNLAVYTYLEQSDSKFSLPNGTTVTVSMIPILATGAGYLAAINCFATRLPLEDSNTELYLIMPDSKEGMNDTLKKLNKGKLSNLLQSLPQKDYEVSLPQFSVISNELNMKPFLRSLGINRIFKQKKGRVNVSKISQNTYFGTSFIGLKSVASANAMMKKQITGTTRRKRDIASRTEFNKPFLFCVIHKLSGLILLNGIVTNPALKP